jgi:hypothetical protein
MPPKYVRPTSNRRKLITKTAEANAETVERPTMRFVPLKRTGSISKH